MMTHLPAGFVIHSLSTLAVLQWEDHICETENSETELEAGGRIEAAGAGWGWRLVAVREAGVLLRPGSQGGNGRRAEIFY